MPSHDTDAAQAAIRLRHNVAAIVRDGAGKILVCERADHAGAWQFPQGGVDDGETHEQALVRELGEEVSLGAGDVRIVSRKGPYRYLYPSGFKKRGFNGVEQIYFLVELQASASKVNVKTQHPEFRAVKWIAPAQFELSWLPPMKCEVYRAVFLDFFGVDISKFR
jgi:putative (di)nucleoside polyphosphate hydrolase